MELQLQPKHHGLSMKAIPSASAAWSFNFNLTARPFCESDTIGFSRMEFQLQPNTAAFGEGDTIGFSPMEFPLSPSISSDSFLISGSLLEINQFTLFSRF